MPITRWSVISRNDEAGWCGRRKHQVVSHRGSLYLLGGYTSAGVIGEGTGTDANLNDVWKSTEGAVSIFLSSFAPILALVFDAHYQLVSFLSESLSEQAKRDAGRYSWLFLWYATGAGSSSTNFGLIFLSGRRETDRDR